MVYTYEKGKEIYKKDLYMANLEAYKGRKFSKQFMATNSKKRKKGESNGGKNKH